MDKNKKSYYLAMGVIFLTFLIGSFFTRILTIFITVLIIFGVSDKFKEKNIFPRFVQDTTNKLLGFGGVILLTLIMVLLVQLFNKAVFNLTGVVIIAYILSLSLCLIAIGISTKVVLRFSNQKLLEYPQLNKFWPLALSSFVSAVLIYLIIALMMYLIVISNQTIFY